MSSDTLMCRDGKLAYIVIVQMQDWFQTNPVPRSRDGCCDGANYMISTPISNQGPDKIRQLLTGVPKVSCPMAPSNHSDALLFWLLLHPQRLAAIDSLPHLKADAATLLLMEALSRWRTDLTILQLCCSSLLIHV